MSMAFAAAAGALGGAGAIRLVFDVASRAHRVRTTPASSAVGVVATAIRRMTRFPVPRRLAALATARRAEARLAAAGAPGRLGPREWLGVKCFTALVTGATGAAGAGALPGRLPIAAVLVAPLAGFAAPDFWLSRVARARLRAAGAELAPMLDLLHVTVEGGAAPHAALGAVGARFTGPLAAEWRAVATAVALGVPHDVALGTLTRRLPAPRVRAFVDSMQRARRRGLPLGELLARQAAAARHEQQIRIREHAARAGPKIQLVVAFVLVPAVMLIVAAALIAELTAPGAGLTY